jgi:hypothetical protein
MGAMAMVATMRAVPGVTMTAAIPTAIPANLMQKSGPRPRSEIRENGPGTQYEAGAIAVAPPRMHQGEWVQLGRDAAPFPPRKGSSLNAPRKNMKPPVGGFKRLIVRP